MIGVLVFASILALGRGGSLYGAQSFGGASFGASLHGSGNPGNFHSFGGGLELGGGGGHGGGGGGGYDHHGGVSIVGAGGSAQKGATFDLTNHDGGKGGYGSAAHSGIFGGSFIATGKHHQSGSGGSHGAYNWHHNAAAPASDHAGLGAYSSPVSSYDVGHNSAALDHGQTAPVLYSSYKGIEHGNAFSLGTGGHGGFGGGGHGGFEASPGSFGGSYGSH